MLFQGRGFWFAFLCPKDCIAATDFATSTSSPVAVTADGHCLHRREQRICFRRSWAKSATVTPSRSRATSLCPIHIHLLISEPGKGTPSTVMQVLKQRVSRRLRRKPRKLCPPNNSAFLPRHAGLLAPILAAPLLRFQRVESDEVRRETPLHAHEPGEKKLVAHRRNGLGAVFPSTRGKNPGWFASIP